MFCLLNQSSFDWKNLISQVVDERLRNVLIEFFTTDDEKAFKNSADKHSDYIADYGYTNIYLAKLQQE